MRPGRREERSGLLLARAAGRLDVRALVAIATDEEERGAVPVGAPHDSADVERAAARRTNAQLGRAADFERLVHGPNLRAHGAQVHGLQVEVAVSNLEDHRPADLGPRVPPEIGHPFFHGEAPSLLADFLIAPGI